MKTLQLMKSDITFSHERIPEIVKSYYDKTTKEVSFPSTTPLSVRITESRMKRAPHSVDLVTATDRIPVDISTTILSQI